MQILQDPLRKKKWESRYDYLADFGKQKRRVHTGSGDYKSYNVPFVTASVERVWFYFESDLPTEVSSLIDKYLTGIGKKVNIGFGWFKSYKIELAEDDCAFKVYARPLPKDFNDKSFELLKKFGKLKITQGAYRPPYWDPKNQDQIMIPELLN